MNKSRKLRELILADSTLVMPDAFDEISARIIEAAGFDAVQCSGYSFSIACGYPTETDVSFAENLEWTRRIAEAVRVPVMADGEDGFGDGDILKANIAHYVTAGVAGANIEDQNLRGPGAGKIIGESHMLDKIRIVRDAASEAGNADFVLNARTDALTSCDDRRRGQALVIERANLYLQAGATLCFITHINTLDEVKLFAREVQGPISVAAGLPYNINAFSVSDCCELGVARVSLPTLAILSAVKTMHDCMCSVRDTGRFDDVLAKEMLFSDMTVLKKLIGQ
jgi:2-methylisocitrate lyase-like PEP mutase family enzyme